MARDWGRARVRQPNFYGQSYGGNLESLATEILRWFGVSLPTGLALVTSLAMLAGWMLLAWFAVTRKRYVLAVLAAAAPVVLSSDYGLFSAFFGLVVARLLVIVSAVVLLSSRGRVPHLLLGTALGAFGILLDTSAAVIFVAVAVYCFIAHSMHEQRQAMIAGLLPAGVWLVFTRRFYALHPDYALHPPPRVTPEASALAESIAHPSRLWTMYAPEIWHSWIPPVVAVVAVVALLVATRRLRYAAPALAVAAALVLALASPRALDNPSPLLPSARILLAVPITVWVLGYLLSEARLDAVRWTRYATRAGTVALAVLVAVCGMLRLVRMDDDAERLVRTADVAPFRYPLVPAPTLRERCRFMDSLVAATRVRLVVVPADGASAYGCAALSYGRYETLLPDYERRTWLLYDESIRLRTAVLVWRAGPSWCASALRSGAVRECRTFAAPRRAPAALVRFAPQPVVPLLVRLGVPVRPFGPGCDPQIPARCRGVDLELYAA